MLCRMVAGFSRFSCPKSGDANCERLDPMRTGPLALLTTYESPRRSSRSSSPPERASGPPMLMPNREGRAHAFHRHAARCPLQALADRQARGKPQARSSYRGDGQARGRAGMPGSLILAPPCRLPYQILHRLSPHESPSMSLALAKIFRSIAGSRQRPASPGRTSIWAKDHVCNPCRRGYSLCLWDSPAPHDEPCNGAEWHGERKKRTRHLESVVYLPGGMKICDQHTQASGERRDQSDHNDRHPATQPSILRRLWSRTPWEGTRVHHGPIHSIARNRVCEMPLTFLPLRYGEYCFP